MAWIYLIRHGRTEWNSRGLIQGHADVPLDSVGRQQAATLPQRLRTVPLTALWASPLCRAQQTAAPLAAERGLAVQLDGRLMERNWGTYQGLARQEAAARHPQAEQRLQQAPQDAAPPQGESWSALRDRALQALAEIAEGAGEGHVAVVTHGGTIAALLCGLLQTDPWRGAGFVLHNASVTLLRIGQQRGAAIHRVNDAGRLG